MIILEILLSRSFNLSKFVNLYFVSSSTILISLFLFADQASSVGDMGRTG